MVYKNVKRCVQHCIIYALHIAVQDTSSATYFTYANVNHVGISYFTFWLAILNDTDLISIVFSVGFTALQISGPLLDSDRLQI